MTRSEETSFDTEYPSEPLGATDPRDLTLPLYGATFGQAVSRYFRSYARFSGRASRSEYWWIELALTIVALLWVALVVAIGEDSPFELVPLIILLAFVAIFAVPSCALLVRRLHDADLSGWWCLLTVMPYIGFALQIVVGVLPSKALGERFDRRDMTFDL